MDYPKSVAGVNLLNGKFTDGDPASGLKASLDPASWANAVTDELLAVITWGGLQPAEGTLNQIQQALQARFTATTNQGLHFQANGGIALVASSTLTLAQSGHWFEVQAGGTTQTLPSLVTTTPGLTAYTFRAPVGFTLKAAGGENIMTGPYTANSITVLAGESLTVVSNGAGGNWYVLANGFGSPSFAGVQSTSGYQKLPGGLVLQWGMVISSPSAGSPVAVTFPVAFTLTAFTAFVTPAAATTASISGWFDNITATGMNVRANVQSFAVAWLAIGK